MAVPTLQLPGNFASPTLDFTPLSQLGQTYQKAQQEAAKREIFANAQLDGTPQSLSSLATKLLPYDQQGAFTLSQLGMNAANTQYSRGRDAVTDQRQATNDAFSQNMQRQQLALSQRSADRADRGPEETASDRAKVARSYGIDPATPTGKTFILTGKLPEGDTTFSAAVEQRKVAAVANGLDPSSPGFQSYVLTGKMPREDAQPLTATDKKAILEADEGVMAAKAAVDSLGRAKQLSTQAFAGPLASQRGYAASFLGNSSDLGKAGIATSELDNEVTSNALTQLKAIFGGAPTEGERKILLDIQGASRLPNDVRQKIYDRAQQMAQVRLKFNEQRANEMRGGQFYKPQGSMTRAPVAQSQGITQQQYEALPSGSPFTAPDGTQRIKP